VAETILKEIKASDIREDRSLTTIPFTVDSTYVNNGNNMRFCVRGKTVVCGININLKALTASATPYKIGSIPSAYAPSFAMTTMIMGLGAQLSMIFQVNTNGEVSVVCPGSNGSAGWYNGSLMWMLS
jgi:hypothetical protein